jgi:hypothetical protein
LGGLQQRPVETEGLHEVLRAPDRVSQFRLPAAWLLHFGVCRDAGVGAHSLTRSGVRNIAPGLLGGACAGRFSVVLAGGG